MTKSFPDDGLHRLKYRVNKWRWMKQNCGAIVDNFEDLARRTYEAAPVRTQNFKLDRDEAGHPQGKEAKWERAIWQLWGPGFPTGTSFLPGIVKSIQTYQMPLRQRNADVGWKAIDLVGVSETGLPVIIELKEPGAKDTPLFIMLEAAAYGICLMKMWNAGYLRTAWQESVKLTGPTVPKEMKKIDLVGLAPEGYWQAFNKEKKAIIKDALPALQGLAGAMKGAGLHWHFASLPGARLWPEFEPLP